MLDDKYIILYADEFKEDIWESYMDILGLGHNETSIKIMIKDVISISLEE